MDLITQLSSGEELLDLELINEDSNSQEIEKPITDTGQVEASTSEENSTDNSNCVLKAENDTKEEDITESDCHSNGIQEKSKSQPSTVKDLKEEQNTVFDQTNATLAQDSKFDEKLPHLSNVTPHGSVPEKESKSSTNPNESINSTLESNIDGNLKTEKEDILLETRSVEPNSSNQLQRQSRTLSNENIVSESSKNVEATKENNLSSKCSIDFLSNKSNNNSEVSQMETNLSDRCENPIVLPINESSSSADSSKEPQTSQNKNNDSDKTGKSEQINAEQIISFLERKRKSDEPEEQASKKLCTEEDQKEDGQKGEAGGRDEEKRSNDTFEGESLVAKSEVGKEIEEPVVVFQGEGSGHDCNSGNCPVEIEVGEEIEEPVWIFQGEGSGHDCETGNPGIENDVGEEIEEPVMFFCGEGSGNDCDTGNPGLESEEEVKNKDGENNHSKDVKDNVENNTNLTSFDIRTPSVDNSIHTLKESLHDNINSKTGTSSPEMEHNDPIERKLSVLTGESYSSNEEKELVSEKEDKQIIDVADDSIERGTRRKSCSEDTETNPPEAKKTKVEKLDNDIESNIKNQNTDFEKVIDTTEDTTEASNGIVDALNVSNSSYRSKDNTSSQESVEYNKEHEPEEDSKGSLISEKDDAALVEGNSIAEMNKINSTLLSKNEIDDTKSKTETNENNLSGESDECKNDVPVKDKEKNCEKNSNKLKNSEKTESTNVTSKNKLSRGSNSSIKDLEIGKEDLIFNKDSHTEKDKSDKADDFSKSNSDVEKESQQTDSNTEKKKPKKSPRPRKKLFTVGRSRRKSKKPLEEIPDPVNSDEEDLISKLSKLDDEESKKVSKKKQITESQNQKSSINKKATNKDDGNPSLVSSRKRRGSQIVKDKDSEEDPTSDKKDEEDEEEEEEVGGKKRKLKGNQIIFEMYTLSKLEFKLIEI